MSREKDHYKELVILEEMGVYAPEPEYLQRYRFDKGYKFPLVNQVAIAGVLVHDPPIRKTKRGIPVTNFVVNTKPDKNSIHPESQERESCYVSVVVWAKQALQCNKFLKKGSVVLVIGELQSMPNSDPRKKFCPVQLSAQWIQYMERGTVQSLDDYENDDDETFYNDNIIINNQFQDSEDSPSEST